MLSSGFLRKLAILCILLCSVCLCTFGQSPTQLKKLLEQKYLHKTLTFRNFYTDTFLQFDSGGHPLGGVHPGPWTHASISIQKIKISRVEVQMEGPQIAEEYSKELKLVPVETGTDSIVIIELDNSHPESVVNTINRIFLQPNDNLVDLVPDYWKPFLSGQVEAVPLQDGTNCYRIKGALYRNKDTSISPDCETNAKEKSVPLNSNSQDSSIPYRLTKNDIPLQELYAPDSLPCDFGSSARGSERKILIHAIVNPDGSTSDIAILKPIGWGCDDDEAIAIKMRKFKPYLVNNRPVSVSITVEIKITTEE